MSRRADRVLLALGAVAVTTCVSPEPEGLAPAPPASTTVKMDFFHRPLPDIPLPNDIATRYDASSATGRRINASMVAPTQMEQRTRRHIDELDGWACLQPIVIPFTGPLDLDSILAGHRDVHYDLANDVVYLVNVTRGSARFGQAYPLDVGNGNYPVALKYPDNYWENDLKDQQASIVFDESDEDLNGNGVLDLGEDVNGNGALDPGEDANGNGVLDAPEDLDADGILDEPNYIPGAHPDPNDLGARYDALTTFYERETNTLILRSMEPLEERTTYAVVVTRRLKDAAGEPVGSPYPFINHTAQTAALEALPELLRPLGLGLDDVAFTFSFTTQTEKSAMIAVRDGLYGHGVQAHLGRDFPPEIEALERLRDAEHFPTMKNPHILYSEQWAAAMRSILTDIQHEDADEKRAAAILESVKYVDYFIIGSFESPQLFPREGSDGAWLPFDDQSWPPDLDRVPAPARSETIYFNLAVPRREVSARGAGQPAPIVIEGHGYTGNRFGVLSDAGFYAKHGLAVLSIDGPSHGISATSIERSFALGVLEQYGLKSTVEAVFKDRAYNQDRDPFDRPDSGADFWTAYLFHTRDIVRQFALDYMQAVRILRGFDGVTRWGFDVDGDGTPEIAGDFDADGIVDVGGEAPIYMLGASLGGIMTMIMGGLEPELGAIAPISGGGGFADMGIRTIQGGALEGFILRAMSPIYIGTTDANGDMKLQTIVVTLNNSATVTFATVPGVKPGDTMVVENLTNGERGCAIVDPSGRVRAPLPSDKGDRTRVSFYAGPQLAGDTSCGLRPGATPSRMVDTFEVRAIFEYDEHGIDNVFAAGTPLVALADGFGLRRGHPDLRRFQGFGQLVLDAADPAVFARHVLREPLTYPGTGQTTGTHALVITTLGDMSVPASSGITFGRAAGLIDYLEDDPRYGKPVNQVLLDNYVAEAASTLKRFTDSAGTGVLEDVEDFSRGTDAWGPDIPRLDPPLRIGVDTTDALGGLSAAIFPMTDPRGKHVFAAPGEMTDNVRRAAGCVLPCTDGAPATDPCSCQAPIFDIGYFMFNMICRYLASGGTSWSDELCLSANQCPDDLPAPDARPPSQIDAP